jgi:hypothetical protein
VPALNLAFVPIEQIEAQEVTGSLSGTVTDPSGDLRTQAPIVIRRPDGKTQTIHSDSGGNYTLQGLTPGLYSISASAQGFSSFRRDRVSLRAGQNLHMNIALKIEALNEQVTGSEAPEGLDVSPGKGGGATILKGSDLDVLSEDLD